MSESMQMSRADFEGLLADHERLIESTNQLEYHVYQMGDNPGDVRVTACQEAAGSLIGLLRSVLFRHDQQVLPLIEAGLTIDLKNP